MKSLALVLLTLSSLLIPSASSAQCAEERRAAGESAYLRKDFAAALKAYEEAIAAGLDDGPTHYDAACCAALAGETERAWSHLEAALTRDFSDCRQLRADSDLASLRSDPRWASLEARCDTSQQAVRKFWDGSTWQVPYAENLSDADKLAGLSRIWSEAKFNFANFALVPDLDWDRAYHDAIPKVLAAKNTADYYRVLSEFVALLHDGHTSVHPPRELRAFFGSSPGLTTRVVEGHVYVDSVFDPRLEGIRPGLEIVAVDGAPARMYAEKQIRPHVFASTPQDEEIQMFERQLLTGPADVPVTLTLADEKGKKLAKSVPRIAPDDRAKLRTPRPLVGITHLDDGIVHVVISTFNDAKVVPEFEEVLPEILKSKGLILDVRENGGGNSQNGDRILAMLTSTKFPSQRWWTREYRPAMRAWGRAEGKYQRTEQLEGRAAAFAGRVILLVGPRTYSAAEDFTAAFRGAKRGLIAGSATGGSTGQPLRFSLPGGGSAQICSKRNILADGKEYVGVGIVPDVEVRTTIDDFRAGRDPVRETAVRLLQDGADHAARK